MNKFTDFLGTHLLPRSVMTAVFGRMLSRARVPRPPADGDRGVGARSAEGSPAMSVTTDTAMRDREYKRTNSS